MQIPREQIAKYGAGHCLAFREQNGYHDSYFRGLFAIPDERADTGYRFEWIETGATAYAGGFCAVPDATEEVKTAYRATQARIVALVDTEETEEDKRRIHKGDTVIVVKGRKIPKGTTGTVMWKGPGFRGQRAYGSGYGRVDVTDYRLGLRIEGEEKLVYTAEENCRRPGFESESLPSEESTKRWALISWPTIR